jgi:UDP-N-acetylglucosamine--N-acetylmuramyl-(pentapeptide) pyrophosphoryl-undecaprenol N-acetylglucosamine transferase
MSGTFVLAAGGTGGHLFPAEALAGQLIECGAAVVLLTDTRSDAFNRPIAGVDVCYVRAGRLDGGPLPAAGGLVQLAIGTLQARRRLRRLRPAAVIGFGGYASLPTMLAATALGLPSLIHEQNAVLGRANRLLAPFVRQIATGFPHTARLRAADRPRTVHTGNPVRPAVLALADVAYAPPRAEEAIELLVVGGSQGAHALAEVVPTALALLAPPLRRRLIVSHQARPEDRTAVVAAYAAAGIAAEIETFFADLPRRLARAHLVICRAGASTVAELAAMGRPAVLIPYPYATDDHQTANACAFVATGGGRLIAQTGLRPPTLAGELERLLADGSALGAMARAAAAFSRLDAARQLALTAVALGAGAALRECAA